VYNQLRKLIKDDIVYIGGRRGLVDFLRQNNTYIQREIGILVERCAAEGDLMRLRFCGANAYELLYIMGHIRHHGDIDLPHL
jgi:hypothetical protein